MISKKKMTIMIRGAGLPYSIYDDATVIYSLRNYFEWTYAILKIRRSSDDAVKFVFFDAI